MGCGRLSRQHPAPLGRGPGHFLRSFSDGDFLKSLQPDELPDKNRLLAYHHLLKDGQFEANSSLVDHVRWLGVPERFRWLAWKALTKWTAIQLPGLFDACLMIEPAESTRMAIRKDLDRTFPLMEEFDEDKKLKLNGILCAFASVFPQVGYIQGMNFVAGFLLLVSRDRQEDAFFLFIQLMVRYRASLLFCEGLPLLKVFSFQFLTLLEQLFPDVHRHFSRECITPELYLTKWILTIFAQPLPVHCAARLWDLIVADGLQATVLLALSLVKLLRQRLLKESSEGIIDLTNFKAEGSIPSGGLIVRTALGLRMPGLCGTAVQTRLSKLRDLWEREHPDEAAELERQQVECCTLADTLLDPAVADPASWGADAPARSAVSPFLSSSGRLQALDRNAQAPLTRPPPVAAAKAGAAALSRSASAEFTVRSRAAQARQSMDSVQGIAAETKVDLQSSMPSHHTVAMRWGDGQYDERQRSRFPAYQGRPESSGSQTEHSSRRRRQPPVERHVPAGRRLWQTPPDMMSSSSASGTRSRSFDGRRSSVDDLVEPRKLWREGASDAHGEHRLRDASHVAGSSPGSSAFPSRYGRPLTTEAPRSMRALSPPERRPYSGELLWASGSTTAESRRNILPGTSASSRSDSNSGLRRTRTRSFSPINMAPEPPPRAPPARMRERGMLPSDPLDLTGYRPDTAGSLERIALYDHVRGRQEEMESSECRAYSVESDEAFPSPMPQNGFYPSPASCKRHAWLDDHREVRRADTSRSSLGNSF